MEAEITPSSTQEVDILSILEQEEATANVAPQESGDILSTLSSEDTTPMIEEVFMIPRTISPLERFRACALPKVKFSLYYVGISAFVFFLLLGVTNWTSYSMILSAYLNPGALKASNQDILSMLDRSKITVYAEDTKEAADRDQERSRLQEKLKASNTAVQENRFSPKKLIPTETKMDVDFEITPYDNRLIIPKIGKNVPLVDVGINSGFDFEHIENIFMKELEKGVVRYPGTARPGENGNAFIFGHSSNYPWMQGEYNSIFALLDQLSFGDEIIIYYNQKKYTYRINEKKVIKPGNVKVLNRDANKKELSLMTCWPIGTTINRLIVFAELEKESDTAR